MIGVVCPKINGKHYKFNREFNNIFSSIVYERDVIKAQEIDVVDISRDGCLESFHFVHSLESATKESRYRFRYCKQDGYVLDDTSIKECQDRYKKDIEKTKKLYEKYMELAK